MKNGRTNQGITLVALVITIIVLLILAGVTIAMLIGENGILNQANQAKTENEIKAVEEKARLLVNYARSLDETAKLTKENLENAIDNEGFSINNDTTDDNNVVCVIDGKEVSIAISDGMITYKGENIDKKLYNVDDSGTLSIKDNILFKQNRNITIPSKLDGKTVTKIANNCFKDTNIEYVNIPSSITTIGSGAFSGCSDLKEIVMPCYFPDGGLSSDSFLNLDSLNKITLISSKNSNKMVDNRNMPWYKTKTVSGIELTIGDGVTEIGQASFADQESIKSVKMSETVKYVGVWAFSSATGLTGVEMKGVTTIDTMAFVNCVKLGESKAQIVIPSTVKTINGNVFGGCGAITIIFEGDRSKISIDSTWLGDNTSAIVKNK